LAARAGAVLATSEHAREQPSEHANAVTMAPGAAELRAVLRYFILASRWYACPCCHDDCHDDDC
jgi:hypothetical protein